MYSTVPLDVARLALRAARDLVNHDVGIRQREPLAFRSGAKQHRAHARRHAEAVGRHVAGQELHRVVDRQTRRDRAAGRVDVDVDVLLAVLHLEEEQLRDDQVRDVIVDRRADENDPVLQQARINVVAPLAAAGLFDHHRNEDGLREIFVGSGHDLFRADGRSGRFRDRFDANIRLQEIKGLTQQDLFREPIYAVVFLEFLAHFFHRKRCSAPPARECARRLLRESPGSSPPPRFGAG